MVKDAQVRVLRRKLMEGKTQEAAAAAAGMSVRQRAQVAARVRIRRRRASRIRWRTRPDPFAEVFESEVAPLLAADEKRVLEARTILGELESASSGVFRREPVAHAAAADTAVAGAERAGQGSLLSPGTSARTRSGLRLHQLRRTRRDDRRRAVRASALRVGVELQRLALADGRVERKLRSAAARACKRRSGELGGVVEVLRSDNLSAATHELPLQRRTGAHPALSRVCLIITG